MGTTGDQTANTEMNDQDTLLEWLPLLPRDPTPSGAPHPASTPAVHRLRSHENILNYPFVPSGQKLRSHAGASDWLTLGHVSNLYFQEDGISIWLLLPASILGMSLYLPAGIFTLGIPPNWKWGFRH